MAEAAIILADGFEEIEAVTVIDLLRRAGITVTMYGLGKTQVRGGHDIAISCDDEFKNFEGTQDAIILPGGLAGAKNLAKSDRLRLLLSSMEKNGKLICAICAAPGVVLGKTGILKGRRFTCYPGFEDNVEGADFSDDPVVQDGNIITSRGPGTAALFALKIVEVLVGTDTAQKLHKGTLQQA